jgi:hypothetical protein
MKFWTIQFIDAAGATQEYDFTALAKLEGGQVIADAWTITFMSQRASTAALRLPGLPPHLAPAIPFESRVTIWNERTFADGAFGAGNRQFQGLRTDRSGTADPRQPSSGYVFSDEWYFLEHTQYYQVWTRVTDNTPGAVVSTTFPCTNVVLYQPNPGQVYVPAPIDGRITTGQQIKDVLTWAITMGANLQIGQIDPSLYCAVYPVQNTSCADALRHCLRLHPDCFPEIDYSSTPPTFNVRQRSNLTAVTLPYSYTDVSGRRHTATDIMPRPELRPKRVGLFYRSISSDYLLGTDLDIWPNANLSVTGPVAVGQLIGGSAAPYTGGGTPIRGTAMANINDSTTVTIAVGNPPGLRALDFAIDLQGPRTTLVTGKITSESFTASDLAWWKLKCPGFTKGIPATGTGALALLSTTVNGGGAHDITVVDETGTAIDVSTFKYELDPKSSVMSWMTGVQVKTAIVTGYFSYQRTSLVGATPVVNNALSHAHDVRIKLTNVPSKEYSFSQYLTTGESIPGNLAQYIYESLDWLQYELTHRMIEKPFNGWIKPGKHAVNLDGGATEWETMAATVQQTIYRMRLDSAGTTFDDFDVKCGPVEHLEAGQLVQLFNVFTNRDLGKIDAGERSSGLPSQSSTVEMPDDSPVENTVPSTQLPTTTNHAFQDGTGNFFGVKISALDLSTITGLN